ncbi:MAG: hypothetical protein HOQ11_09735 [Gemmatimonadaceae bacterium]|nr:hypothetical protein [Gemmatimonadaceae bacterium]NUQ91832.1 hypothetical protein [Gemmatimonadaceae bacterium]NUR20891.1 hypothetical protein [Gemmatimonadaceae bacterium]NUS97670.1 hypothetical protein [Gemmatimonadaceae bacterium]
MRKIGCLVVLLLGVAVGWLLRDQLFRGLRSSSETTAATTWESLSPAGAARMRAALAKLQDPRGPVFVSVRPADLASYVYEQLAKQLPPSADSLEAGAFGERLYVRASVKPSDFGGSDVLGPLAGFLADRERMQFGGTFHIIRPGLAEFRVQEIRFREFPVPTGAIPRLLRRIEKGARPQGVSEDGLPLVVPSYIGDVRVKPGTVTLYRNAPAA